MLKDVETDPIAPSYAVDTSVEAAVDISKGDRASQRLSVLGYINMYPGTTRLEIKRDLGLAHQSCTARVWELLGSNGRYKPVIYEAGYKTFPGSKRRHRRLWIIEENDDDI